MRAYKDTITLELLNAERTTLEKFYNLVSHGVLSDLTIEDIYSLLENIANKKDYFYSEDHHLNIDIKYILD